MFQGNSTTTPFGMAATVGWPREQWGFNPGAFSHYAYALTDALAMFEGVKIEVHLSNPYAREEWRRHSVISPVVDGTITGLKTMGYRLAIEAAAALIAERNS